jgi:antitoxin component of MazEF toxin-antitoxin module
MKLVQKLGERTKLAKAHSESDSLRITVPKSIVKQWNLKEGEELDWSWQARNNEMILEVRKVEPDSTTKKK